MFTALAPASMKHKVPVVKRVNGVDRWFIGDRDFGTLGGNVIRNDQNKLLGRLAFPTIDEGHACAHEVKPRLKMMDEMGVYAKICFHNSGVTQTGSLMSLGDPELALAIIRMYNEAARNRQQESGDCLFTLAHPTIWDKEAMEAQGRERKE